MANRYLRDAKIKACNDIISGKATCKDIAKSYGATVATVKKWVERYKVDKHCFDKPTIKGGLKDELQKGNGLIATVRGTILPDERGMSVLGYNEYTKLYPHTDKADLGKEADRIIEGLLKTENELFQEKNKELLQAIIPYYKTKIYGTAEDAYPKMHKYIDEMEQLFQDACRNAITYDEYLEKLSQLTSPVIHLISFSIMQSAKSRAGAAFENILKRLLDRSGIVFETQVQEDKGQTITDFVIPTMEQAKTNPSHAAAIECQTTLKDRFRLTTGKSSSTDLQCYLATPTGLGIFAKRDEQDISLEKLDNIVLNQNCTLIVFPAVKDKIKQKLEKEKESDDPKLQKERCEKLLASIDQRIISFSMFFKREVPLLNQFWS